MTNAFRKTTMVWEVNDAAALTVDNANLNSVWIKRIVYVPNSAGNQVTFQNASSENVIVLKAGATDTSPVTIDFDGKGRHVYGLKCSAISSGSDLAYVYLQ